MKLALICALALTLCLQTACSDDDLAAADAGTGSADMNVADSGSGSDSAPSPDRSAGPDGASACSPPPAKGSFFALSAKLGGKERKLCNYRGKVLLVVNIAAKCGFTPQLGDLAKLQSTHSAKTFEVLGFYCNQFANQGGTQKEQDSCEQKYGVNFDTFDTLNVNAPGEHAVFSWLKAQPGGGGAVTWNFEKWLIGKDGKLIAHWGTGTKPDDTKITTAIKAALAQ